MKNNLSIYIHYPFCISKCPYCDFNSYKLSVINQKDFLNAYLIELENYYKLLNNRKIKTIFFGGGTPSIASIKFIEEIIKKINNLWGINNNTEISLEANPTTVEINKFYNFKQIGINRLSIGIQSLDNKWLSFFGRTHDKQQAIKAIEIAQKIFDKKYSIDLIYARPKQKINDWLTELNEATTLSPFHISLYQLIIEKKTEFFKNKVKSLDDENASEMYKITNDFLKNKNINMYEVSNYAQNNFECKHNINYWKNGEWIGIGAGAHGRICFNDNLIDNYKIRTSIENYKIPEQWLKNVLNTGFGYKIKENLTKNEFIEEILLMGLRLKNGINLNDFKSYLKINKITEIINENYINIKNYISITKNTLKVKYDYFNLLDSIILKLLK